MTPAQVKHVPASHLLPCIVTTTYARRWHGWAVETVEHWSRPVGTLIVVTQRSRRWVRRPGRDGDVVHAQFEALDPGGT